MQVKKSIKKVGAVAGSALMVGMTFGAAAPLADFPQPFVDDDGQVQSQIVVGSQGKVADVVGAINIGASVGQSAVQTTEETASSESTEVDGVEYDVALRGDSVTQEWIDASDYSELARETVQDSDGDDHRILEQIAVQDTVDTVINGTDVWANVDSSGAVQYKVSYTPGFSVGENIPALGNDYEVTAITDDGDGNKQVSLGSKVMQDGLELSDSYEHEPYTVTVVDKDESSNAIYVEVAKDGEVLKAKGLETGNTMTADNEAFELTANDVFFGSQRDYIDVTSVYTDTKVVEGEDSPMDADYTVSSISGSNFTSAHPDAGTVSGMTLSSDLFTVQNPEDTDEEDDISYLGAGEAFAGPADYFDLTYQGLSDTEWEEVTARDGNEVSFTDVEGFDHTLDMTTFADNWDGATVFIHNTGSSYANIGTYHTDVRGHPVEVDVAEGTNADEVDVTVSYKSFEETATLTNDGAADTGVIDVDTGYGFHLTVDEVEGNLDGNADGDDLGIDIHDGTNDNTDNEFHTAQGHELHWDGSSLLIEEAGDANDEETTENWATAGSATVAVDYGIADGTRNGDGDSTTVDEVDFDSNADGTLDNEVTSDNEDARTTHGSTVHSGDFAPVNLNLAEEQVNAQVVLGSTETASTDGETYDAVDWAAQGNLPSMAMLDSDVQESHKANNHLILVGGPAVNTLVSDLVDAGDVDLSELEASGSGALIQGVSDAFADGQHALVVAGVEADDTRSAAQYVSNYASHESALSDTGDRMVLDEADYPSEQ